MANIADLYQILGSTILPNLSVPIFRVITVVLDKWVIQIKSFSNKKKKKKKNVCYGYPLEVPCQVNLMSTQNIHFHKRNNKNINTTHMKKKMRLPIGCA